MKKNENWDGKNFKMIWFLKKLPVSKQKNTSWVGSYLSSGAVVIFFWKIV